MKDEWIIKILIAVIIGLISWSAHREITRLDRSVEVLHQRLNGALQTKQDRDDTRREFSHVWDEIKRLRK